MITATSNALCQCCVTAVSSAPDTAKHLFYINKNGIVSLCHDFGGNGTHLTGHDTQASPSSCMCRDGGQTRQNADTVTQTSFCELKSITYLYQTGLAHARHSGDTPPIIAKLRFTRLRSQNRRCGAFSKAGHSEESA